MAVRATRFQRWISPWVTRAASLILRDRREVASRIKEVSRRLNPPAHSSCRESLIKNGIIKPRFKDIELRDLEHYHLSLKLYAGRLVRAAEDLKESRGVDVLGDLFFRVKKEKPKDSGVFPAGMTDYEHQAISGTKADILSALEKKSHERTVKFDQIIDEAIAIARDHDRSAPFESLLYRARKITDVGGNIIATVVNLLQDIPLKDLEGILEARKESEIYKIRGSIIKILKNYNDLENFDFAVARAEGSRDYIESKMKELIRQCKYFETFLVFFFKQLQEARKMVSPDHPLLERVRFLYAPLAERMQFIFLADDFRDQYLRIKDPSKYKWIEENVVKRKTGMNYDEAKIYLRGFVSRLQEYLRRDFYESLTGLVNIFWRAKSPFSIWNKVEVRKEYGYDSVFDILGVKLIGKTVQNLKDIAEILINGFNVPAERIHDNLDQPRASGFQALIMLIHDRTGRPIEIQLMTEEMDYKNTFDKAGTWRYNLTKDLKEMGVEQEFDITITGLLNGDPEKNFYRMYHHWAAF